MLDKEMILHDDYEQFAKYLGVDYEDYVELLNDCYYDEDDVEIEYPVYS